jgi:isopenicillin N synthase-like dioxygenase
MNDRPMHQSPPPREASLEEIPIIDAAPLLDGGDIGPVAAAINTAGRGLGFFYLRNHGVDEAVMARAFAAARRFFALPEAERMKVAKDRFHRGYLPMGTTKHPGQKASLKDSFDLGLDLPLDDPDVVAGTPLHGPNQWPQDLPGFREDVEAYFEAVKAAGLRLLRAVSVSLGEAEDYFPNCYRKPTISMRMIRYPAPEDYEDLEFGIGAASHTDYGLLTILAPDPAGGLEIMKPDGEWISAPYVPGAFVVNCGDLMGRWSNGVYHSNKHRVVNRLRRDRISIPFFFNPDHRAVVQSLRACTTPENPAKHPPILAGDYITEKMKTNQGYKPPQTAAA